jgi:hypothetical protein
MYGRRAEPGGVPRTGGGLTRATLNNTRALLPVLTGTFCMVGICYLPVYPFPYHIHV